MKKFTFSQDCKFSTAKDTGNIFFFTKTNTINISAFRCFGNKLLQLLIDGLIIAKINDWYAPLKVK